MSAVSIRRIENLKWQVGPEDDPENGVNWSGRRFHHEGDEETPQLFEVHLRPNQEVVLHAHEQDEIIYILGGEMRVGNSTLGAGSSIAIKGRTIYGFKASDQGVHFLNFRPCMDASYLTVEDVKSGRAA